jgi:hypothetical protein
MNLACSLLYRSFGMFRWRHTPSGDDTCSEPITAIHPSSDVKTDVKTISDLHPPKPYLETVGRIPSKQPPQPRTESLLVSAPKARLRDDVADQSPFPNMNDLDTGTRLVRLLCRSHPQGPCHRLRVQLGSTHASTSPDGMQRKSVAARVFVSFQAHISLSSPPTRRAAALACDGDGPPLRLDLRHRRAGALCAAPSSCPCHDPLPPTRRLPHPPQPTRW